MSFQNKYLRLQAELREKKTGAMTVFGYSMLPVIKSGATCTYEAQDSYEEGDIVFCKVKGRFIDAHLVAKVDKQKGYLIANKAGRENGWTKIVFGRVVKAEWGAHVKTVKEFAKK